MENLEKIEEMVGALSGLVERANEAEKVWTKVKNTLERKITLPHMSYHRELELDLNVEIEVPALPAGVLGGKFLVQRATFDGRVMFEVITNGYKSYLILEAPELKKLIYATFIYTELKKRGIDVFEEFKKKIEKEEEELRKTLEILERVLSLVQLALA